MPQGDLSLPRTAVSVTKKSESKAFVNVVTKLIYYPGTGGDTDITFDDILRLVGIPSLAAWIHGHALCRMWELNMPSSLVVFSSMPPTCSV